MSARPAAPATTPTEVRHMENDRRTPVEGADHLAPLAPRCTAAGR
jgi:hypothetical protein